MKALFGLFLAASLSAMEQPPIGWSVTDIHGRFVASNGQVILLVFASPCTPVDTMLNQTLKPLSTAYPDVLTVLVFPTLSEAAVRGWCAQRGGIPSNMCAVSLPPTDLLAPMFFGSGTNIWPTTWMLDKKGTACAKWLSFTQKPAMEPSLCRELEDLQIRRGSQGEAIVSWKALPLSPTIHWKPPRSRSWDYSLSFPFGHPTNAGRVEYRGSAGFYKLEWD